MISAIKIQKLAEIQAQLRLIKEKEMALRLEIHDELNKGRNPGTYHDIAGSYRIKSVLKYNYRLNKDDLEASWNEFTEEEQLAIKFTPTLSLSVYKRLDEHDELDNCLTVSPATPSISIEDLVNE